MDRPQWKRIGFIGIILWGMLTTTTYALCTVEDKIQLYAGPGTENSKTSWLLHKYTPLRKVDVWNDWYQVEDMDGDKHWVHASGVSDRLYCLAVNVEITRTWRGPGTEYGEIGLVKKHETFLFANRQGQWSQAVQEGKSLWILSKEVWVQ